MIVMPKYTSTGLQVTGRAADSAIHSGSSGNDRIISMKRWISVSIQPPK